MGIKDRITRLERNDESCVVCGWGPRAALHISWDHDDPDEIVVTWGDADGA